VEALRYTVSEPVTTVPWYESAPLPFVTRRKSYSWLVVGTVCIGAFMGQVDASIAQLLLPVLEVEFQAPVSLVSWVAVAYLLVVAAALPIFGRLADITGRKLLYTAGFVVFILGSALCGVAPTLELLITARVFQGVGAALLASNSVAIIVTAVGDANRGRALGMQGAAQAVGLCAGPVIGGLLIYYLGWRWVFWVNVPFGILGAILGWLILPQTRLGSEHPKFDWGGAALLGPTLTVLVLALNQGSDWGIMSPALLGCVAVGSVLLIAFVRKEMHAPSPLLDMRLFRRRAFSAGNIAGLLSYAILFGVFFLMPFVLERAYRETSLGAGLRLAVVPIVLGCVAPFSGGLSDRLGARWLTAGGMLTTFAGLALLFVALDGSADGLWLVTSALGVIGMGQGLFTAPNNSAIMAAAPAEETGEAGGVLNLARSVGTAVGIALASAVLSWQLASLTGRSGDTRHAPPQDLLVAARMVIAVLGGCAVLAAFASLIGSRPSSSRGDHP
jgi:EmrB/QacA subfamily drug resistance transporter